VSPFLAGFLLSEPAEIKARRMIRWVKVPQQIGNPGFEKYYLLLSQKILTDIESTPEYDTHECLTFPWWEPETHADSETV
jgi:hypothetical protein